SDILRQYWGGPSPSWPDQHPVDERTIFTLASLTKLPTTVAALQLVDRKLVTLDSDVGALLPVLGRQPVLAGWRGDGSPILRKRRNTMTLRHLLTHSSGCGYDFYNPDLRRLRRFEGTTAAAQRATVADWFGHPLVFEPGHGWEYGCGLDWAGRLVEQVSGLSLEDYLSRHVWTPLGGSSFTFWPDDGGRGGCRLATLTSRNAATGKLDVCPGKMDLCQNVAECFGGHGGYCGAADYAELLVSLLANDGRVLSPAAADMMFQDQLSETSKSALQVFVRTKDFVLGVDYHPAEVYTWGLGGIATQNFQFIDRTKNLCGLFMTHIVPAPDAKAKPIVRAFLQHVYKEASRPDFPSLL
ncbi:hypothetical protein E4U41_002396, partial [Claviceps citrina]